MAAGRGLVLGKFMPPTTGHLYLVDAARSLVDDLDVLVCSLPDEPIDGDARERWMRQLCPRATVYHLREPMPAAPQDHPEFWTLWRQAILRTLDASPDIVLASEDYGHRLAQELGARFWPIDLQRHAVPISASAVRENPQAHWHRIPDRVQPYFLRRVAVAGPESAGKSTLCAQLAQHFATSAVPEYARTWLAHRPDDAELDVSDFLAIARGQQACEDALARRAHVVLFCDTDALATLLWCDHFTQQQPEELVALADQARYDLVLLCQPDLPWVPDEARFQPELAERQAFATRLARELDARRARVVPISGHGPARLERAIEAVEELLARPAAPEWLEARWRDIGA